MSKVDITAAAGRADAPDAVDWHTGIAQRFDAGYTRSAAFKERFEVWSDLISRYAARGARVLDAGCGPGVISCVAAGRADSVLAIDGSAAMIELAEARRQSLGLANLAFRVARLDEPGLLDGQSFDLILCSSVLEYVDDWGGAFLSLGERLAPGGVMIFSMPNGDSLYRQAERLVFHLTGRPAYYAHVRHVLRPAAVAAKLEARGWRAGETGYYAAAPLVSRPLRALGRPDLADALFVMVVRRAI